MKVKADMIDAGIIYLLEVWTGEVDCGTGLAARPHPTTVLYFCGWWTSSFEISTCLLEI
jgi:hypothetical protein